jgi:hypothetical protein
MHKKRLEKREAERRSFAACRTIDVTDRRAMRFWAEHLGVTPEDIAEVVKQVGPNSTAVALKLEAPQDERTVPPDLSPR